MATILESKDSQALFQSSAEVSEKVVNHIFAIIGQVNQKAVSDAKVFLKDNVAFALLDKTGLYFRISEDDYQIIGDKYKIIRMNDRRYIFERVKPDVLSSPDDLLQLFTKVIWEMSGKLNNRY